MFRLRGLYEEIRTVARSDELHPNIPLARLVTAILGLIGLEALLVLWLYELPVRAPHFERLPGFLRLAEPSILLTHPKGPLCLLLVLIGVAIVTVCRDLAELTRKGADDAQQKVTEIRQTLNQGYVLAGFGAVMTFLTLTNWGG